MAVAENTIDKQYLFSGEIINKKQKKQDIKYIIDMFFDVTYNSSIGFHSNGDFCFVVSEDDIILEIAKTKNTERTGLFINANELKRNNTVVKVFEEGRDVSGKIGNLANEQKIRMEIEAHYYKDFQLLFDKYIYNVLVDKIVKKNNADKLQIVINLIEAIERLKLQDVVSSYICNMVASYNESYFKNIDKIYFIESESGISSELRFDICINDEKFKKALSNNNMLLQIALDANALKAANVRGVKEMALGDYLSTIDLTPFEKDAEIKLADYDRTGGLGSLIRFNNIKSKFKKEIDNLPPMITEKEKERIKAIEMQIMNYSASDELLEEYQKIIKNIWNKFVDIKIAYKGFDRNCKDYGVVGNLDVEKEITKIENEFINLRQQQMDFISEMDKHEQNNKLSCEIDRHGRIMEDGVLYIDFEKQAIIDKIKEITSIEVINENDSVRKTNLINNLIRFDLPNLKTILFRIEAMGGMKKAFAGKKIESARRDFFGEHYKLNDKVELYKLFAAAKKQKVDINIMIFNVLSNYIEESDIDHEALENIIFNAMNCQGDINSKLDSLYNTIQSKLESNFSKKTLDLAFQTIKTHFEQMDKKEFMQLGSSAELQSILNNAEGFLVNKVREEELSKLKQSMQILLKETIHEEINSLIVSVDDLFDDTKQNLDLYKLLEYRLKLQDLLSRTQGDGSKEEWVTSAINYVDGKLLNFSVQNEKKEKTINKKDEDAYKSIIVFEQDCIDCKSSILIKNNQEYQNLLLQRKSLEEKIKQVESGSGLAPLMGNKEKKKEELERQVDAIDSKMAAMKKAFDCNYGNELDDALRNLANGLSNSFDSGDSIYVRDSAEKVAAKENRWE